MLQPFESVKKMKRRGEWQCDKCNKLFRGEDYVRSRKMNHTAHARHWGFMPSVFGFAPCHVTIIMQPAMNLCAVPFSSACWLTLQLDKHLSRKHMDLLNHSASTCLEDYCDILECDHDRLKSVCETKRPLPSVVCFAV